MFERAVTNLGQTVIPPLKKAADAADCRADHDADEADGEAREEVPGEVFKEDEVPQVAHQLKLQQERESAQSQ